MTEFYRFSSPAMFFGNVSFPVPWLCPSGHSAYPIHTLTGFPKAIPALCHPPTHCCYKNYFHRYPPQRFNITMTELVSEFPLWLSLPPAHPPSSVTVPLPIPSAWQHMWVFSPSCMLVTGTVQSPLFPWLDHQQSCVDPHQRLREKEKSIILTLFLFKIWHLVRC